MNNPNDKKLSLESALRAASNLHGQNKIALSFDRDNEEPLEKAEKPQSELLKALNLANGEAKKKAPALAFTQQPAPLDNYLGLYKSKRRSLPDDVIKQVRMTDSLVASILRNRGSMLSLYGQIKPDRFNIGIEVEIKSDILPLLDPEQFRKVRERMKKFESILLNCGHTEGLENQEKMTLSEFLDIQTRNALSFGRFACFPEKTTVYTPTGPKNIESLKIGDEVYSHDGSIQKVKNTMNRDYDGILYGVHTSGNETVWATNEHPFYAARDEEQYANGVRFAAKSGKEIKMEWINAENLNSNNYIHFPKKLESYNSTVKGIELPSNGWILKDDKLHSERFTKNLDFFDKIAKLSGYNRSVIIEVYNNSYRMSTKDVIKEKIHDLAQENYLKYPEYSSVPSFLELNEELAYFLGVYTGDGSLNGPKKDGVYIHLGLDKANIGVENRISNFYRKIGLDSAVSPGNGDCIMLRTYCPPLGKWLHENIGSSFDSKIIPNFIFGASDQIKLNFLAGLVDTDGCTVRNTTISLANEHLAKQCAILANSLGIHSKVSVQDRSKLGWNNIYVIKLDSKNCNIIPYFKTHKSKTKQGHTAYDNNILKRITNIYKKQYTGKVYNIEVEKTNTYLVNGISVHNCEIIYDRNGRPDPHGNYPMHRFRPVDVATIFRTVRKGEMVGSNMRTTAIAALESITGEKFDIDISKLKEDKFAWMQVVDGIPRQAFTDKEMIVFNMFPSSDIEHNGYPVSPLDTIVTAVSTHISVERFRELYFQNGRASKGILVIKSDEVDQQTLDSMKLQFNASINSVSNSFRTPIFGIGQTDQIDWLSMTNEGLGGDEFMNMYDGIARTILSAFGMSPDELAAMGHLSRGSNSQTLSESSNEYKLTASRDAGLRPLILKWQTFINQRLFPIIDPLLSQICEVKFSGLDAQSKEQESTRLQQDSALHLTFNQLLHEVDKDQVGKTDGGDIPFSERFQAIQDKYLNVGDVITSFMGIPGASIDPMLKYKRDPFWLQQLQLLAQVNPEAVQAFFAPKPFALEFLKMNIEDSLDENGNN